MRLLILTVLSNFYKGLSTDLALDPHEFLFWLTQSNIFFYWSEAFSSLLFIWEILVKEVGSVFWRRQMFNFPGSAGSWLTCLPMENIKACTWKFLVNENEREREGVIFDQSFRGSDLEAIWCKWRVSKYSPEFQKCSVYLHFHWFSSTKPAVWN